MKRILSCIVGQGDVWQGVSCVIPVGLCLLVLLFSCVCLADSDAEVTEVTATPRHDGSGVVDISYTLVGPEDGKWFIVVRVSVDGGGTWSIAPSPAALSGDAGPGIGSGIRQISWDSKIDLPWAFGSNYRVKVVASPDITWVAINDPGVPSREPFTGYMSKYETTNAQFAKYLNDAKASNDILVEDNYIKGNSGPHHGQDYYYLAGSGSTGGKVTKGGAARIKWTGSTFTVDAGFENHPVTYVSWYGSTAFASYYRWRLPTRWEWRAVADFDGSYSYGCGVTINNSIANSYYSNHPHGTTTVGSFGTYGYGMADMAGNVWEWSSSLYGESYRFICGGGWLNLDSQCAVSGGYIKVPHAMDDNSGFRVCR